MSEMALFMVLIIPLPFTVKRKLFTYDPALSVLLHWFFEHVTNDLNPPTASFQRTPSLRSFNMVSRSPSSLS